MFKFIYNLLRKKRYKHIKKFLIGNTILEIGSTDSYLKEVVKNKKILCTDIIPRKDVIKQDVENLKFENNSFDCALCLEVLEHTKNPVKALNELKRVAKRRVVISIPYEPWFTFWRFMIWEKEHLWAIRPKLLKIYLGKPSHEETFLLKRYYIGVWDLRWRSTLK